MKHVGLPVLLYFYSRLQQDGLFYARVRGSQIMSKKFITDIEFKGITSLEMADFENCRFIQCNFASTDLSDIHFTDCFFEQCDLSNAKITKTAFQNVRFESCKLIGLQFDTCNPFLLSFHFNQCILNYASFFQLKIPQTQFSGCSIEEADFSHANLNSSTFRDCNLIGSMFENTQLEKADLYSATQIIIDPERNNIRGARFSFDNIEGLLIKYDIVLER